MENQNTLPEDKVGLWGERTPVTIDINSGLMSAGKTKRPIDLNGDITIALSSYLSMVYELRAQQTGVIPLRKDDIEVLADAFEVEDTHIAEKLARLMHCDDLQTKRFIQMLKKGRVLVPVSMVAAGALLAISLNFGVGIKSDSPADTKTDLKVNEAIIPAEPKVDIGTAIQVERAEPTTETVASTVNEADPTFTPQTITEVQPSNDDVQVQDSVVTQDEVGAPYPGPGEVVVGEGIRLSRDSIQE